jgi:hypothetical protein
MKRKWSNKIPTKVGVYWAIEKESLQEESVRLVYLNEYGSFELLDRTLPFFDSGDNCEPLSKSEFSHFIWIDTLERININSIGKCLPKFTLN